MWFRGAAILTLLLCFCWLFKPVFAGVFRSVKKVRNDFKKIK